MTYLFTDVGGLPGFLDLNAAMADVGRTPYLLPTVERAVYRLEGMSAAPRIKVGADVLPWWPVMGVYILVERGSASPAPLADVEGVGGAWWGAGLAMGPPYATGDNEGLQITYCFLDDQPAAVGERLRPVLEERWRSTGAEPLLAAPFQPLAPYDWGRYLP
jgi:hypothetical protein